MTIATTPKWRLLDQDDGATPGTAFAPMRAVPTAKQAAAQADGYYDRARDQLLEAAAGASGHFSLAEIAAGAPETVEWCHRYGLQIMARLNDESLTAHNQRAFPDFTDEQMVQQLLHGIFGLGPIQPLVEMPGVEDVAVNGPDDIWYKAQGGWQKSDIRYRNAAEALRLLNNAVAHTGRLVSPTTPIVDAYLPSGDRLSLVGEPIADPWPSAVIRVHRKTSLTAADLVRSGGEDHTAIANTTLPNYFAYDTGQGEFSALSMTFLHMAVLTGFSILVCGGTGCGKTTVLSALGKLLPADRRMVIIEDTPEISLDRGNVQRFITRPESLEGLRPVTQTDLVRVGLRQRPDALTLGEARGGEILDLLKALRTGHRNGLSSIHTESVEDVYDRILQMLLEARLEVRLSSADVAGMVAKAFDLVIMLKRSDTGRRYVQEISEFTGGVEQAAVVRTTLFEYDRSRMALRCTGRNLTRLHEEELQTCGYSYASILDAAKQMGD